MVPALDRAVLFGDGVFETLRAYGGRLFRLERHLGRLRRSMDGIGLQWPFDPGAVRADLDELLDANGLGRSSAPATDARIRITITGGRSDGRIRLARSHPPTVLMTATPLATLSDEEYARGISLATAGFRQAWNSPLARIKTIHRLEYLMAREEAVTHGADNGLILDDRGLVAEGTASNIALITGSTLATPSLDGPILAGVTREAMLEAATVAGFAIEERAVRPAELLMADEVVVTSTSWEVLAVREIDGTVIGRGSRGPAALAVHQAFRHLVAGETGSR